MEKNNLWYMDAVFYELHVKAFYDSNGDGIDDFKGLSLKLDYLVKLGVDCIWLLPFYPSPMCDDGYDISDYYNIHQEYGTLKDFEDFLAECHNRNIKVIIDLVTNHVSDQHPWFREARNIPESPKRNWFIWSDTNTKFERARIVFGNMEHSNWTWDSSAKMYYWHRFYSHQPDLNYDNPKVVDEMKNVITFSLDKGVDGFRCDAVAYLFEREGGKYENLPETHVFFREVRRLIDEHYPGRILLAEVNEAMHDTVSYFGKGDEFHMVFNFPLMQKVFIALARQDSHHLLDMIGQSINIPKYCIWATFLRNHDELILRYIEERDLMYYEYANNPRTRIHGGIRRRLAPLLGNSHGKLELLYAFIFSVPGSPVIYYGDEIGMGDNIYLADRNGLRTPMQWNADRNAGFSQADSDQLYLPLISNPLYHYNIVNVDIEEKLDSSLLRFVKKMIRTRKRHASFGMGSLEGLETSNTKVIAFVRCGN
jgi:maltose alpha-D-glucosyltransferase / alpha-amylase